MFSKFLAKYANEMRAIGSALDVLQHTGALRQSDRARIASTVEIVQTASTNVEKAVNEIAGTAQGVEIDKKALQDAVNAVLPSLVATAVAKALAEAQKPKSRKR